MSLITDAIGSVVGTAANTANPANLALEALTEFNKFLQTPQGQVFAERSQAIIDKVLGALHLHIAPDQPATPAVVTPPQGPTQG